MNATDWVKLTPYQKLAFAVNEVWRGKAVCLCVEPGCSRPAGTPWTRHWCWQHDEERRERITKSLKKMAGGGT